MAAISETQPVAAMPLQPAVPMQISTRSSSGDGGASHGVSSPLHQRPRVALALRVWAVSVGETEDEDPVDYFGEALQEDEVDDLQQNVEECALSGNDENELTVAAKERELAKRGEFQVYEVVPEEQSYGEERVTRR